MPDLSTYISFNGTAYNLKDSVARNERLALTPGTEIPNGADLDDYKTPGNFACLSTAIAATLTNAPIQAAFNLAVLRVTTVTRLYQIAFPNTASASICYRYYNGTSWTDWFSVKDLEAATETPSAPGTAAVGSSEKYAREDHVHPEQTDITGNAGTATKLRYSYSIDGIQFNGSSSVNRYGYCETAANEAAKTVTVGGSTVQGLQGTRVVVRFRYGNTADNPTLNVNGNGAYPMVLRMHASTTALGAGAWQDGEVIEFVFIGSSWVAVGAAVGDDTITKLWGSLKTKIDALFAVRSGTQPVWTRGSISSANGRAGSSTTRLRTDAYYRVDAALGIQLEIPDGYKIYVHGYTAEDENAFASPLTNGWQTGSISLSGFDSSVKFVRLVLAYSGDGTITSANAPDIVFERKLTTDGSTVTGLLDMIAEREEGMVAAKNHIVGTYIIVGTTLYRVTSTIAAGGTLTEGGNVEATTVMGEIARLASS